MGEEIRGGAGWIPWEEGRDSCSPPGAPAPGSDFNPGGGFGRLGQRRGLCIGRRACSELGESRYLRSSGAKALNRRASGLFAPSRKAFHQGATCPRAAEYRSPETASPRPPEGRARPLLLLLLLLAAAGGDWRSPG